MYKKWEGPIVEGWGLAPPHPKTSPAATANNRRTIDASAAPRSTVSRSYIPPQFTVSKFDGMAIEARVLKDRDISGPVGSTLVKC